jgi:hypothetical protein
MSTNVATNGSAIRNLENVVIHNEESKPVETQTQVKHQSKKAKVSEKKLIESIAIQESYVEKYNVILRYESSNVYIMPSKGDKQILLGKMTDKGLDRNTGLSANNQIMDLIAVANRKFSPVSKAQQEERKLQQMNLARAAIASLF